MANLIGTRIEMLDVNGAVIGRATVRESADFGMGATVELPWREGHVETCTLASVRKGLRSGLYRAVVAS